MAKYFTLHSLLMANYVKNCGLIMLNSENDDLKYGIISFCVPSNPLLQDKAHLNKAPESNLTPIYLTPTQLGANKTAIV